jgi:hypothetical protein
MPGMTINYDYGMYTGCTVRRDEKVRIDGARDASMSVERRSGPESDSLAFTVELCASVVSGAPKSDMPKDLPVRLPWPTTVRLGVLAECASAEKQAIAIRMLRSVAITSGRGR